MKETFIVAFAVLGNILGSGFFLVPAFLAPLGSNMIYSWLIACSIAMVFALTFGNLYLYYPNSSVLSDYFEDPIMKKTIAILYWLSAIIGNAGLLIIVVSSLNIQSYNILTGFIVIAILTLLNHFLSYSNVIKIEVVLTLLKFFLLIALPISLFFFNPSMFKFPAAFGSSYDISALGISAFWSFIGIETAGVFGKGKSAKQGLILGVVFASLLYVFTSFFIVGSVPLEDFNKAMPFALLVKHSGYSFLEKYMGFLLSFTSIGALYGWVAATSKMALCYSKDKTFPACFKLVCNSGVSSWGLWISSSLTFLLFLLVNLVNVESQFNFIADLCVNLVFLLYALCSNVLFLKSNNTFDYYLGLIGMLLVLFACSFSLSYTIFSISMFISVYYLIKLFDI